MLGLPCGRHCVSSITKLSPKVQKPQDTQQLEDRCNAAVQLISVPHAESHICMLQAWNWVSGLLTVLRMFVTFDARPMAKLEARMV